MESLKTVVNKTENISKKEKKSLLQTFSYSGCAKHK